MSKSTFKILFYLRKNYVNKEGGKLQSGKEYHYDITINHHGVDVTASINKWDQVTDDVNVSL